MNEYIANTDFDIIAIWMTFWHSQWYIYNIMFIQICGCLLQLCEFGEYLTKLAMNESMNCFTYRKPKWTKHIHLFFPSWLFFVPRLFCPIVPTAYKASCLKGRLVCRFSLLFLANNSILFCLMYISYIKFDWLLSFDRCVMRFWQLIDANIDIDLHK